MAEKANRGKECSELGELLRCHIPGARAECTPVPACPELSLYLLNADYPQQELDSQTVQAVLNYPAYWAFCWASGQVMARYLLDRPQQLCGKRVLDFGSGSGVAGIAAALAGAEHVIACDIDADARQATAINASLNGVSLEIAADFLAVADPVDLILVADVLYDRANLHWLEVFLKRAPQVLVADSRVRDFAFPGYRKLAQLPGNTVPDLDEFEEYRQVSLYQGSVLPSADW
jgi:predicted nicotinamide N-methyase